MIKVLLFAGIAEKVGRKELEIDKMRMTVIEIISWIKEQCPSVDTEIDQAMFAVNEEFVELHKDVVSGDIIAIIPPVSGG